jgi:hypothetical protein
MSEMLWIAVPGGIKSGSALLRVLIVPKLDGGSLSEHGMAQWPPSQLREGTVRVEVFAPGASADTPSALTRDLTPAISFQSGLWAKLTDGITVESGMSPQAPPAPAALTVHATSRDAQAIASTLKGASQTPITTELGHQSAAYANTVRTLLDTHWSGVEHPVDRQAAATPPAPPAPPAATQPAGFHRTLSLLREHPAVLRALGLVLEITLDANALPTLAGGTIRVRWPGHVAPLPAVVSPRTRFGAQFLPGSTANVDAGMVTLDRRGAAGSLVWDVATVDIDVSAQRLREAAVAMTARPGEPTTLPAMRSGGLQLVLRGRGEQMAERLDRATRRLPDVLAEDLTADDLLLGYRIDLLPQLGGSDWFSLQQREAVYRVHGRLADGGISDQFTVVESPRQFEEGHIKTNAAIHDGSGLHADEIVAAWRGWSLATPPPPFDLAPHATPPSRPGMNLTMSFKVAPKTLPRLRFGRHYALRARVADIAGGGLEPGDPTPSRYQTPAIFYGRYEPMLAPGVALLDGVAPTELGPGETVEHVVVRSDPAGGLDIAEYTTRFDYRLDDKRQLLPPSTTLTIAEQHGRFDRAEPRLTWDWAQRGMRGGLPDPAAGGISVVDLGPDAPPVPAMNWQGQWPDLTPRTVHLTSMPSGRPQAAWQADGRLVVRVAPAERITLQLSTFPREGIIDEFAMQANLPGVSMETARQGRHPMLTPARTVTFVHAVQRPLRAPDAVLKAHREPGQTYVTLHPDSPLLDPKSTAQLDITASWDDVTDAPVTSLVVDPDDSLQPQTLFRHEFGDTRHRTVNYTLSAVSRFRHYFRDSDPTAFTRVSKPPPVVVLNSRRPAPPVVLSARSAFEWVTAGNLDAQGAVLTRKRLSTRVRLTLQPPWHTTGVGELVGVIVRPDGDAPGSLEDFVSLVGHDPLYPSFGFLGGGPFAGDITSGSGVPRSLRIAEAGADAVVKPHAPAFHSDEQSWLCDVGFTAAFNHTLVQLAVARYQPNSLDGLWISEVVRTDLVPILPERTLTVTRKADRYTVKLSGPISSATAVNRVDLSIERCRRPDGMPAEQVDLVEVGDALDGVPAWKELTSFPLEPAGLSPNLHWASQVFLPNEPSEFRLRIREVELLPNSVAQPGIGLKTGTAGEVKERTVFTDIVALPRL